jgi:ribosomal protein S18 acetylase RimI-like enzyme
MLLHSLARETFALACPPHTTAEAIELFISTVLSVESFGRYLSDPARALFIAEAEGQAVGYAMVVLGEPSDPDAAAAVTARPTAELSKIYVVEGNHGQGIAPALLDASIDFAREAGARTLWLGVNQENERANRFYAKSGFVQVGTKRFLVGDRYENDFVRERNLGVDAS